MVTQNHRNQTVPDEPREPAAKRLFTKVLRAAAPLVDFFEVDTTRHTARGIISSEKAQACIADLSFNCRRSILGFIVRLPLATPLTPARSLILLKVQNNHTGLTNVTLDVEDHLLQVRSFSLLPGGESVSLVVSAMLEDVLAVLGDDTFLSLVS